MYICMYMNEPGMCCLHLSTSGVRVEMGEDGGWGMGDGGWGMGNMVRDVW